MKPLYTTVAIVVVVVLGFLLWKQLGPQKAAQAPANSVAPTSAAQAVPSDNIYKVATDPKLGQYVTDFDGKTLYTFDKDSAGVSNCTGQCAALWPYYTSGATAQKMFPTNISVIKSADGHDMFAWKGMPLYYYSKDTKAGDTMGDGIGGVWHIIKP